MVFKANSKNNLQGARWLLVTSLLLLVCFVGYWLNSQYINEKQTLKKEVLADLSIIQREIADSILFERYISPIFNKDSGSFQKSLKSGKRIFGSQSTITYSDDDSFIEARTKAISKKLDFMDSGEATLVISDINSEEQGYKLSASDSISMSANGSTLTKEVMFTTTTPDSNIIDAIASLLRSTMKKTIKDSLGKMSLNLSEKEMLIVKKSFAKTIHKRNQSLHIKWMDDSNPKQASNNKAIILPFNIYDNTGKVIITRYSGYLVQKIIPQILFALLLVFFVIMAYVVTYRNLQRQIKLSDMKNSLISNMSHELKTPVATVKVALEAISDYGIIKNPEQALEYVQMARLETQRLEMLINKALNTSLLEQGKITLQHEQVNIAELTTEITQSLKLRLQQNNTQINLFTEGNNFILDIDKLHIQGVLLNIIDNSIKYGTPPVLIDIHIIAQDATITITIADNGPGIPEKYSEQVFDKFFRVPTGDKHNVQGYGLGLSYVKQVMHLHGGMVQQHNKTKGGSKFTLQFFRGR